jgi:hypothetical protein
VGKGYQLREKKKKTWMVAQPHIHFHKTQWKIKPQFLKSQKLLKYPEVFI